MTTTRNHSTAGDGGGMSTTLRHATPPARGHYDGDKISRITTTWTRTEMTCIDCGGIISRGIRADGRTDLLACTNCSAVFAEVET